jgi:uncharacterized UBP type Zn finger protein
MFAKMLLGNNSQVSTVGLTKSFQWTEENSFEEHDVDEFCVELFRAIEESLIACTEGDPDFISKLYEGSMGSYVECLSCHRTTSREETFRDIKLSLSSFDKKHSYRSIEESLNATFIPDKLEGNNQYECGECKKKVDALKYYRLAKLPPILTFHLKRFNYDVYTGSKYKLNDKMTFPLTLNINYFLKYSFALIVALHTKSLQVMKCYLKSWWRRIRYWQR